MAQRLSPGQMERLIFRTHTVPGLKYLHVGYRVNRVDAGFGSSRHASDCSGRCSGLDPTVGWLPDGLAQGKYVEDSP